MKKDVIFIKQIFKQLDVRRIRYCILRNENEILSGDAHDIDMVVDFERYNEFREILKSIAKEDNWKFDLIFPKENYSLWGIHLFSEENGEPILIHFDVFNFYGWNGYCLIPNKYLLEQRRKVDWAFAASEEVQAVTMLFSRLLYHGYIKEKYRDFISDIFIREPDKVSKLMNLFIDESDMSNIMSMVQEKQWDNIENGVEDLRERIIAKLSRLQKFVLLKSTVFKVKRLMNNIGIIVQLNGDEDFKRSFSSKIAKKIERSFGGDYTIIDD